MHASSPLTPLTASHVAALTEAATNYNSASWLADDYLAGRGINPESVDMFRLGVVADPLPGHDRYRDWLSIPYLGVNSETGEVECWSIRFRCLANHSCKDHGHGKYQTISGEKSRMFGVRAIHEADDQIHVTEGELDAVILNQCGLPAVAIPGANNWKRHHGRLLAGFDKVYVWGDPDAAGAEFVTTVTTAVRNSAAVKLIEGDVNETFLVGGADALYAAIKAVRWG